MDSIAKAHITAFNNNDDTHLSHASIFSFINPPMHNNPLILLLIQLLWKNCQILYVDSTAEIKNHLFVFIIFQILIYNSDLFVSHSYLSIHLEF